MSSNMKVIQIGNISSDDVSRWDNPSTNRVYSIHGISPCLNSMNGGGSNTTDNREGQQ